MKKAKGPSNLSRRGFLRLAGGLAGASALALSGCAYTPRIVYYRPMVDPAFPQYREVPGMPQFDSYAQLYGALYDSGFEVPAVDLTRVPPQYRRQLVQFPTNEPVGTVIVDTASRHLYLVQENGMAIRYGVGIGREGFEWSGRARIQWKQKWPKWTPPDSMIARQPELAKYSAANGGKPPGLDNPLGARALYIFQDGVDTLYRIHGTPEYWTIGTAASSGCVRMMNQDVIDLYDRVPNGTPIIVI